MDTILNQKDIDRVDGVQKVTGSAKYSFEYDFPGMVYGVLATSNITKGTISALDTKAAENAPGVLAVITHLNCPELPGYKTTPEQEKLAATKKGYKVFADNIIRFNGQPIAVVVADTFERATYAASLIKASYNKENFNTDFEEAIKSGTPLEGNNFKEYVRGEANAWKNAPVKIEATYTMPIEVHNPMEIHGITVVWEGPDKVTLYEKTQALSNTQQNIMRDFGLKKEDVRIITQFIGGAFGSAFNTWPHSMAALIAGRKVQKPIKLMLTRNQMFTLVGYRPQAIQKLSIGATQEGKLVGITHEATAMTGSYNEFTEGIVNGSRSLYNCPNVNTTYKVFPLDLSQPTWMRGPGETTGAFALESALDEMAYALKMDPIEFRIKNYAETDLERKKPYSSKYLKECYELGAEKIKWNERNHEPRSMREGDWLIGYGTGSGIFSAWRGAAKAVAKLFPDGTLILQSGVTDMGPGTATAMTNLAAETMGLSHTKISFELGDTNLPPGPLQGGSGTTSTLGTAVFNACENMKKRLAELVKDNPVFHTEIVHNVTVEDLVFENGYMTLKTDKTKKISYADVLKNAKLGVLEISEDSKANPMLNHSAFSYSVHFVKVKVHSKTGVIKIERAVTAVDAGKIINEKTAESQIIGAVVGGIGMSLMEEGVIDHRYGRWVNNNFADYHVAVNADVPNVEVLFVDKPDPVLNPIGAKGMGEVGIVGFAAAVCNAIFHATGKRIREIPVTPDKLI
ncbi:MAG TPA: xanthine dehydrogenase family protein molybdopterin-binding subunit [Chitinophagaceae bacterium]|nr:xanthine dehydrogenase family protein molybdopterin-binding subunit [Chitinophagaceae bacterium]